MHRIILLLLVISTFSSCKNENSKNKEITESRESKSPYPASIQKVFEAHGGLDQWKTMNTLVFGMERNNGVETTLTDLKSRQSLIETPTYKLGYNGRNLWLKETDTVKYRGNPKFYNGLMVYFYAMPNIQGY